MPQPTKTWLAAEYWATSPAKLEVAQSALLECGALGLEIDDGLKPDAPQKYPEGHVKVTAYFEIEPDLENVINDKVSAFFSECGLLKPQLSFAPFKEEDWQANFVRSCTTFMVPPDIFIVPSFEIEEFSKIHHGKLFIEIEPENAFGTGQHQTTKLCLTNIREILGDCKNQNLSCLDVGCGSGILAILMKKLGAAFVLATETDEDALKTAHKNAVKNKVNMATQLVDEAFQYAPSHYDLVVANILAPVLIGMAGNLVSCLKPQGKLILSGILLNQAQSVIEIYVKMGLFLIKKDNINDWCALVLQKK